MSTPLSSSSLNPSYNSPVGVAGSFVEGDDVIEKLRATREDILIKLTRMHLLFNIDAVGDSLASLFEDKSKSIGNGTNSISNELIERMNKLIDFISQDSNIIQEGIFRRCGSLVRQQELKTKILHGFNVELESGQYTVHDCANVLKTFLSELSEPLLTDIFFKINCQIPGITNHAECSLSSSPSKKLKKLKKLQLLLILLPANVRKFIKGLLTLLSKVSSHSDSNRMDSRNIATLFAPHLLFPKDLKATEMQQHLIILTDELQFMIDHADVIFSPPNELVMDARREYRKLEKGEAGQDDDVVDTVLTFCSRENIPQQSETEKHLAELYAYISTMPETPKKRHLIKQFNRQNGGITPLSVKKEGSVKEKAMKVFRKGIRKGLNLFPNSKGTPSTPKSSRSCDHLAESLTPLKASSPSIWSSDPNLLERSEKLQENFDDSTEITNGYQPDDLSSPKNNKKPKISNHQ